MSTPRATHRLSAILSADAVGYSRLVSRDERVANRRMDESRKRIAALVAEHDGRVVDAVGDNLLAEFGSVGTAVACAVAIQSELGVRNAEVNSDQRLPFRIGIEIGDVLVDGDRITGEGVNVAARLESLAPVGGLAISGAVRDQLAGRLELELQDLGERRLHNIPRPVQVFRADLGGGAAADGVIEGNLPTPRTSFIGRTRARAELLGLLASERLVTLTGLGGAGKTRLALQSAHDAAASFDGGAWWVELQALSDPEQVVAAVAQTLSSSAPMGLAQAGGPEDQIAQAIGRRPTLLVLDNCEHLADACAALADALLSRCAELTLLATSREPLEVAGERVWQVATLEVPRDAIPLADASDYEAIALFVDRARSVRSDFELSSENFTSVQQICAHLDGIPLAIELAAVRVRHLSPKEISQRLDDRFKLLVARRRRSERRHQTLQATLDWSFDLLDESSRALFRRLAVFPGRFGFDPVEAICGAEPVAADDVLELLGSLVDRSFVVVAEAKGATRYRLLETMREYAEQKLDEAGEREATRSRHFDWFARAAVDLSDQLFAPTKVLSLWGGDFIASHGELLDDFSTATDWALGEGSALPAALPIATAALLRGAGRTGEVFALIDRIDTDALEPSARAHLMMVHSSAYTHDGDFARAYEVLDECIASAEPAGLSELVVAALGNQLVASIVAGKETRALAARLIEAAEPLDDPEISAFAVGMVGSLDLIEGRFSQANRHLSRSVELAPSRFTVSHGYAIVAALLDGDEAGAEAMVRRALAPVLPVDPLALSNHAWNPLRSVALWHAWTGDLDEARRIESVALACQQVKPMPLAAADHLITVAAIAFFEGDAERCARLLGVGRRAMAEYRSWRGHDAGPLYLHFRQRCVEALGDARAERLREEGLACDPDTVLAEIRADLSGAREA
jgi:predicted ATPase/class 3 adenylate cyclase